MKQILKLFTLLLVLFIALAACSSSGNTPVPTANVVAQLTIATTTDYLVDKMTVSIQKSGGPVLIGVTDANGIARITVTETGNYDVISVAGVDATTLAEGSTDGREFKKNNPIVNPYPRLTYTVPSTSVNVTALGSDYPISFDVPAINKVTVLKVGSVTSDTNGAVDEAVGTTGFIGRVMISNLNCNDSHAGVRIASDDVNVNSFMLYINTFGATPGISYSRFYGGPSWTETVVGFVDSYTQAGPIYFEAPGTDSGDWAIGCALSATDLKTRNDFGGADATRNFPQFNGGASNFVFRTWSTSGGSGIIYSFNYRVFKFDEY